MAVPVNQMAQSLKFQFKRALRGSLPLVFYSIFSPHSVKIEYLRYIRKHGYRRHLFTFAEEYEGWEPEVLRDPDIGLHYVVTREKRRLYFKRNLPPAKIARLYKSLVMEQDKRSPHCYWQDPSEYRGASIADVGSAEGFSSLQAIEDAEHVYLFETDKEWEEALKATFKPWHEKVTIVPKFVSDRDSNGTVKLDTFFDKTAFKKLFIKMDIEGAEPLAIRGALGLLRRNNIHFAICTYHNDDHKTVPLMLRKNGCDVIEQFGYFNNTYKPVVVKKRP